MLQLARKSSFKATALQSNECTAGGKTHALTVFVSASIIMMRIQHTARSFSGCDRLHGAGGSLFYRWHFYIDPAAWQSDSADLQNDREEKKKKKKKFRF